MYTSSITCFHHVRYFYRYLSRSINQSSSSYVSFASLKIIRGFPIEWATPNTFPVTRPVEPSRAALLLLLLLRENCWENA